MLEDTTMVEVLNTSNSRVVYTVPELGVTRRFTIGEIKKISIQELRALSYIPGGLNLMKDFLCVRNSELLQELGIEAEPEYFWTEEQVKDLLMNGSIDRLKDALDYAPQGVRDKIKDYAIEYQLNDLAKRDVISKATGINISTAIALDQADKQERAELAKNVEAEEVGKSKRRVPVDTPIVQTNYKVVTK